MGSLYGGPREDNKSSNNNHDPVRQHIPILVMLGVGGVKPEVDCEQSLFCSKVHGTNAKRVSAIGQL